MYSSSRHVERTNSRRTVNERLQTDDKQLTKDCRHELTRIAKLQAYNKLYNEEKKVKWRIKLRNNKRVTIINKFKVLWLG